jgi:two-component system, sensor histidine kinase and response regulator
VTVAPDGQAAVDAYLREAFDLILMDVQMPVLSGFDATREIRRMETTTGRHMPIVAMTARAMKGDRERCLEAGMDDYLSKPIQGQRVIEVIRRLFSGSPVPAGAPLAPSIDEEAAQDRVGGDTVLLRQVKDLCVTETPKLLDAIEGGLASGEARSVSAAAHTLRGMCLIFAPNEVVTIAGRIEELADAKDLGAATIEFGRLRPAADHLLMALRPAELAPRAVEAPLPS